MAIGFGIITYASIEKWEEYEKMKDSNGSEPSESKSDPPDESELLNSPYYIEDEEEVDDVSDSYTKK